MRSAETKSRFAAILLLTASVSLATAAERGSTTELQMAKQRLASRANGEKGYPKAQLDLERRRLDDLIGDLEAGRHVDPQEIDQAIERANSLAR